MIIGDRISDLRKQKNLSQGEIEKRSGLLRCYISRVENGHTVPSVETLERLARALEIPMYRFFCDDSQSVKPPKLSEFRLNTRWPESGRDSGYFFKLRKALARMRPEGRRLVMYLAQKVSSQDLRPHGPAINGRSLANGSKDSISTKGKSSKNQMQKPLRLREPTSKETIGAFKESARRTESGAESQKQNG